MRTITVAALLAAAAWAAPAMAAPYSSHTQLYTCCTDSATKEAMFSEAAQSGAAFIRVDVAMDIVIPEFAGEGARDWSGLDEVAGLSGRHGLPVLAVLHGTPLGRVRRRRAQAPPALRGNNLIRSAGGEDCLSGGAGRDRLEGGTHRDRLYGGPGGDRWWVGAGPTGWWATPGAT